MADLSVTPRRKYLHLQREPAAARPHSTFHIPEPPGRPMATATAATTANPSVADPVAAAGLRPLEHLIHAKASPLSQYHPQSTPMIDSWQTRSVPPL